MQEMELGIEGFVEQFVPRTNWSEPRSVSPEIYRAAMESLQDTPMMRLGEPESESEEEEPAFVWQTRRRQE